MKNNVKISIVTASMILIGSVGCGNKEIKVQDKTSAGKPGVPTTTGAPAIANDKPAVNGEPAGAKDNKPVVIEKSDATVKGTAEGIWSAKVNNYTLGFVVLENGLTYGISIDEQGTPRPEFKGTTVSRPEQGINGTFKGNAASLGGGASYKYKGIYTAKTVATLTMTPNIAGGTVNLAYHEGYDKPPAISALAGNYNGRAGNRGPAHSDVTFSINPQGQFSVSLEGGILSGTVTSRASGKSIFDVTGLFSASSGQTLKVSGIAYFDVATKTLTGLAIDQNGEATAFIGQQS